MRNRATVLRQACRVRWQPPIKAATLRPLNRGRPANRCLRNSNLRSRRQLTTVSPVAPPNSSQRLPWPK
jgi:hypothetical protein